MSAKLLGLVGSPRKDGNTDVLVDEALAAFREFPRELPEEKGETEKVYLGSLQINPCQGRFSCKHGEGLDAVAVCVKGKTDRFDYRVRRTGSAGFGGVSDP